MNIRNAVIARKGVHTIHHHGAASSHIVPVRNGRNACSAEIARENTRMIGTMMLPILGSTDRAAAREPARQLGFAFQLTNFIRDVAEDLARVSTAYRTAGEQLTKSRAEFTANAHRLAGTD